MPQILGPNGQPISSSSFVNKKAPPPKLGNKFGDWAGRDLRFATLPGGGVVQFDLDKLEVPDFRQMRDHYQVNASLAVLTFMQHQSDWIIECDDNRIAEFCTEQLANNWTMLNRSLGTANWAGYSPSVLEWENDYNSRSVVLSKIKDLIPEECSVNWREEELWAPPNRTRPKTKVFDGIKQFGMGWPIPVENSLWYPLLMEQGNHDGRKLLRPAFQSWFFSILLHLFANRYYERFGEPVPVGRAPFDEDITVNNEPMQGNDYLLQVLQMLRSRAAVVLPNSTHPVGNNNNEEYDYQIEYLESQMRGADFERYMTRLDEEISIGLFTPILLLRTADVGSYNLGVGHMQIYLQMLNAINDDRALYINKYILSKMVNYNFSENAPRAKIIFRKLGNSSAELIKDLLLALINKDKAVPDLEELGKMSGMTLKEVKQTLDPAPAAPAIPAAPGDGGTGSSSDTASQTNVTTKEISNRVRQQIEASFRDGSFGQHSRVNMGYKRKFERSAAADDFSDPAGATERLYTRMDSWLQEVTALGRDEFASPNSFMGLFDQVLANEVALLANSS